MKRALCFLLCLFFVSHAINDACRVQLRDYHRDLSHALHWPHWQLADNAHANSDEASQSVVRTQPEAVQKQNRFHGAQHCTARQRESLILAREVGSMTVPLRADVGWRARDAHHGAAASLLLPARFRNAKRGAASATMRLTRGVRGDWSRLRVCAAGARCGAHAQRCVLPDDWRRAARIQVRRFNLSLRHLLATLTPPRSAARVRSRVHVYFV